MERPSYRHVCASRSLKIRTPRRCFVCRWNIHGRYFRWIRRRLTLTPSNRWLGETPSVDCPRTGTLRWYCRLILARTELIARDRLEARLIVSIFARSTVLFMSDVALAPGNAGCCSDLVFRFSECETWWAGIRAVAVSGIPNLHSTLY